MKKLILSAAMLVSITTIALATPREEVNQKVLKAFSETFGKVENVVWHEFDTYYQANFKLDEIQVRAQYDEDGGLIRTIRYYGEKQLLPNIVSKLKKKYASKEIFGVTETTTEDEVTFHISIKDANHWYMVKSDAYGNLEQTDKFKRADN